MARVSVRALAFCLLVLPAACSPLVQPQSTGGSQGSTKTTQKEGLRVAAVPTSSPNFDHFEGVAFRNACADDSDCKVAGCGGEVCSADAEVTTACMEYPDKPAGASCGCVKKQCVWYRISGEAAPPAPADAPPTPPPAPRPDAGPKATAPEQGQPCPGGQCAPGLECVTYFGVAGPRGGTFTSCEIRCAGGHACPRGQECVQIADGPGQVCRPAKAP